MPDPHAVNLRKEERLTLRAAARFKGVALTPPDPPTYATAVINVRKGTMCFTLDGSNPVSNLGLFAYPGQSVNITEGSNQRSIIRNVRMAAADTDRDSEVIIWYFD